MKKRIKLNILLERYRDVFRVSLVNVPPIKVPPLQVKMKFDAVPTRCHSRRYSPDQIIYMKEHFKELIDNGLAFKNTSARSASPPRIVPKKNGQLRMTVDIRGPNAMTIPLQWPMPVLEVVFSRLVGKKFFFTLDWFKGFWQLGLHVDSQEWFTMMGIDYMVTPARVLMGQCDAVAYCQSTAQTVYGERYGDGIEAWLDDTLGSATEESELMDLLEYTLKRCLEYGLKLNPSKCDFFDTHVIWCGRAISADGVGHDSARVKGMIELEPPTNAQQLQQFVCALNWMRLSIPEYNKVVSPLTTLLGEIY